MEKLEERIFDRIIRSNSMSEVNTRKTAHDIASEVKDIAIEFAKYHEEYYYLLPYSISESFERFLNERYK